VDTVAPFKPIMLILKRIPTSGAINTYSQKVLIAAANQIAVEDHVLTIVLAEPAAASDPK
jgi:hypothetical protein